MKFYKPYVHLQKGKKFKKNPKKYKVGILVLPEDNAIFDDFSVKHGVEHPDRSVKEKITLIKLVFKVQKGTIHPKPMELNVVIHHDEIPKGVNTVFVHVEHEHITGFPTNHGGSSTVHYPEGEDDD